MAAHFSRRPGGALGGAHFTAARGGLWRRTFRRGQEGHLAEHFSPKPGGAIGGALFAKARGGIWRGTFRQGQGGPWAEHFSRRPGGAFRGALIAAASGAIGGALFAKPREAVWRSTFREGQRERLAEHLSPRPIGGIWRRIFRRGQGRRLSGPIVSGKTATEIRVNLVGGCVMNVRCKLPEVVCRARLRRFSAQAQLAHVSDCACAVLWLETVHKSERFAKKQP